MRSEKRRNRLHSAFIILALFAAVIALVSGCKGKEGERRQAKAKPDVTIQNGIAVLTLGRAAQENAGITVAPLKAALHRQKLQAYGAVLQPDALIDIRNNYLSATAAADKAAAALDASRREYERLKKLNEDDRNISDKALQAAGAALASSEADASASKEKLQAVKQTAMVRWGRVVSGWIFHASPELNQLAELKEVLIRITLPADKFTETAPGSITIQAPGSKPVSARFVSHTPSADPRTQGAGFLYAAPSHASVLIPGMNVPAFMPSGPRIKGTAIPFSSVVWFQGKAWAYVQTGPEHFARREVPVMNPARDGYFVRKSFRPGEMIVIRGAQMLQSQELLPSESGGGGGEDEEGD